LPSDWQKRIRVAHKKLNVPGVVLDSRYKNLPIGVATIYDLERHLELAAKYLGYVEEAASKVPDVDPDDDIPWYAA
jgi:CBS domain-containing protein